MAILESRTQTGLSWVKESVALFKTAPRKWLLLALAYVGFFMMLPSVPGLQILAGAENFQDRIDGREVEAP